MSTINRKQQSYLEKKYGNRVNFRRTERKLYGHDIAAIPAMVEPFLGNTLPDAVIQPQNEAELVEIVRWAAANNVPLTPRGKATSGYGGVLPVKKGLVIDFYRMKLIKDIDTAANTATVQAGVVWEKLDKELQKKGLTLKLYPSSYPSATVGGWLAQGGHHRAHQRDNPARSTGRGIRSYRHRLPGCQRPSEYGEVDNR
jgi:FAD/FMN-containing dehydrogenase